MNTLERIVCVISCHRARTVPVLLGNLILICYAFQTLKFQKLVIIQTVVKKVM